MGNFVCFKIIPLRSNVYYVEELNETWYDVNMFPASMIGKKWWALITPAQPLDVIYRLVPCQQDD